MSSTKWSRAFDPENKVFRNLARLADIIGLSVLWLLVSVPLVTIGPATAALYQAARRGIAQREDSTYRCFFRTFRENFKVGALASVVMLLLAVLLYIGHSVMYEAGMTLGGPAALLYYTYRVLLLIPVGVFCWMFPLLSRFEVTFGGLFLRAAFLAVRYLPSTVILALLLMETMELCIVVFPLVVAAPAVCALLSSLFIERVFRRLVTEEDGSNTAP